MLGREYTILGTVKAGSSIWAAAWISDREPERAFSEQFPPNGVYVAEAQLNGATYRGVANLGYRPTVADAKPERLLELHLFDLNREIYGEESKSAFVRYLRPEKKFDSLKNRASKSRAMWNRPDAIKPPK